MPRRGHPAAAERSKGWSGEVRIRVEACGICHSDVFTKEGLFPGIPYPIVPGHEIAGVIDAVGSNVVPWAVGQRVGVGWYGGHCGHCDRCRRGDFVTCRQARIPGLAFSALARIAPMIETYPLEQAAAAYERMTSGAARFRVVLTMGN